MGIKAQVIQWVGHQRAEKLRHVDLPRPDSARRVRRSETRFRGNFFRVRAPGFTARLRGERVRLDVLKKRGGSRFYALEVGSASSLSPGQLLNSRACLRRAQEVQQEEVEEVVVGRLTKGI